MYLVKMYNTVASVTITSPQKVADSVNFNIVYHRILMNKKYGKEAK